MPITRPDYRQIANLDVAFRDVNRPGPTDGFYRSVVCELPMVDTLVQQANAEYTYTTLYPAAIAFDQDTGDIYVRRNPVGSSIENSWTWISVYDGTTFEHKTLFAITNVSNRQNLVVRTVSGDKRLYVSDQSTNDVFSMSVATLPAALSLNVAVNTGWDSYDFMSYNHASDVWMFGDLSTFKGFTRKNRFLLWNSDHSENIGRVNFPFDATGDFQTYAANFPKAQGVCQWGSNYVFACGADYNEALSSDPEDTDNQQGMILCAADGGIVSTALCRPDKLLDIFRDATGRTGLSVCENEGAAVYGGELYALWATVNPGASFVAPALNTYGLLITKEFSKDAGRLDCTAAASSYQALDARRLESEIHQWGTAPVNPITGAQMTTFSDICTFMAGAGLSRMAFYGSGSLTDFDSNVIDVSSMFLEFLNANGSTFLIRTTSLVAANCRTWWVSGTTQTELNDTRYT